jgi:H+/Cl- antiporter ClcA
MKQIFSVAHFLPFATRLARWIVYITLLSVATGSMVALFLWLLDRVTLLRWQHPWLLYLLPLAGVGIYFFYKLWGKNSAAGNNLIITELHTPGAGIPTRMGPLVLVTTIVTHLFGGSAGREGTALQIGGSIAHRIAWWLGLSVADAQLLLLAGIAAGFGAVFGTPVTGAIFALEVVTIGRIRHHALLPCLLASVLADAVCTAWGIHHTSYHIAPSSLPALRLTSLGKVALAGAVFGIAGYLFAWLTEQIKHHSHTLLHRHQWLIPALGGLLIIALTYICGTTDYLGLGVTASTPQGASIVNAFQPSGVHTFSWLWKLLFTAITLGMGFKGGEVTPLFFIGAALGNTLAPLLHLPPDLLAGLGFIAVFAAATNTPLACTLMGVELFGGQYVLHYAVACYVAYYCSGHSSIYSTQRIAINKYTGQPTHTQHQDMPMAKDM